VRPGCDFGADIRGGRLSVLAKNANTSVVGSGLTSGGGGLEMQQNSLNEINGANAGAGDEKKDQFCQSFFFFPGIGFLP